MAVAQKPKEIKFTADDGWTCKVPDTGDQMFNRYLGHMHAVKVRDPDDRFQHYQAVTNALFGNPQGQFWFRWNPWAEKMITTYCHHRFVAVGGSASSGKSQNAALWGLLNFLASPRNTLVLVTTTTMKDSDQRVWGMIKRLWNALPRFLQCGKLVGSLRCIRYKDMETGNEDEMAGIYVVAGEKSGSEAASKFIGKKNKRVYLIADELTELSESVLTAALSNLSKNEFFQCIGLGNPSSHFDPFGLLAKPKAGWGSINVEDEEWETERGWALHFDGTKSPNIKGNDDLYNPPYPFIYRQSHLDEDRAQYVNEKSPAFYRMVRGFWCPTGETDNIYTEADIIRFGADDSERMLWLEPPTPIAGLDPSFTSGGDRTILTFGYIGINAKTLAPHVAIDHAIELVVDVTNKEEPPNHQIVRQVKEKCRAFMVDPKHFGFDSTGAGIPFGDIIAREWSDKFLPVNFGGAASELPTAAFDPTPANMRYSNRVTELWFGAQEYIRSRQISGLTHQIIKEMCVRKYKTVKKHNVAMSEVEPKDLMKERTKGVSPDHADSCFVLLAVARERCNFGRVKKPDGPAPAVTMPVGTHVFQPAMQAVADPRPKVKQPLRLGMRGVLPARGLTRS